METKTDELHKNGILLYHIDDVLEKGSVYEAAKKVANVLTQRPKSIIVELNTYRKNIPIIIEYIVQEARIRNDLIRQNDRFYSSKAEKDKKRWTEEEDNALIEKACYPDTSLLQLSIDFGRTTSAIQSRLTYLVGVKRISKPVVGRFFGKADGKDVEMYLDGTVYTEK